MALIYIIIFIILISSTYLGMHYYVYTRIVSGLLLSAPVTNYLRFFFLIAALSFVLSEFLSRHVISSWIKPFAHFGTLWLGVISISISVFLIADILRVFFNSQQFRYYSTIYSISAITLLTIFSIYNVSRGIRIKEIKLKTEKLPKNLSKFSIVQLSDLHLDFLKNRKWFNDVVEKTNALNPDIIVITGDLIDTNLCNIDDHCELLTKLKSKYGVYAITGNHEYYTGLETFLDICKNSNINVLRNEKVTIANCIELAGVNDEEGKRFSGGGPDLNLALKNCDFKKPVILLAHRPTMFKDAVKSGVDLQLSGHTHAGQIPPVDLLVTLIYKYSYGFHKKNSSYIYTTFGTGTWGPPMRLFSRSEIVKIIIEK
ncbi:MAG: hypothetical protein A2539_09320 [Elusimicrobia bacterium RIFOXYD2_FULL_34_15]|nr:MAG: hypothetical protein A2539_09320 [Elusimicrobia bacterium RIFOXYD2_FULL_34_15]